MIADSSVVASSPQSVEILFNSISYSVPIFRDAFGNKLKYPESKTILGKVSGRIEGGKLTGILGSSGAGKTTLLNFLAGQLPNTSEAQVYYNGTKLNSKDKDLISGFVHQDDVILGTMTVREAVLMAAKLKLPRNITEKDRNLRVDNILTDLGIKNIENNRIGDMMAPGLSGGQKRRVSLAMELIANPLILYGDELTTGLDSFSAYNIVKQLKELCHQQNKTIICTIHQPNSSIFYQFDNIILLAAGGNIIYNGPVRTAVEYFNSIGYCCPSTTNMADYIFMNIFRGLKLVLKDSVNQIDPNDVGEALFKKLWVNAEEKQNIVQLAIQWTESSYFEEIKAQLDASSTKESNPEIVSYLRDHTAVIESNKATTIDQIKVLLPRAWNNQLRNKLQVKTRLLQNVSLAFTTGFLYLRVNNNQTSVKDRTGALFYLLMQLVLSLVFGTQGSFSFEKLVFKRECGSGLYNITAYFFSKIIAELPSRIIFPTICAVISYFMIGFQQSADKFFIYLATFIITDMCAQALGIWFAAIFPNVQLAMTVVPDVVMILMVVSGFLENNADIPKYILWLSFLSPVKYAYQILVRNEFFDLKLKCSLPEESAICLYSAGEQVVADLHIQQDNTTLGEDMAILICLTVAYLALAYLTLWNGVRKQRKV
jgi:ABC-type multidrug transport system ATPase subunit